MGGSVERLLPSPVLCLCDRPALHSNAQKKAAVKAMQEEERCRSCDRPRQVQFGSAEILHFDVDGIECKTKGDHFLQNDMQDDIADEEMTVPTMHHNIEIDGDKDAAENE